MTTATKRKPVTIEITVGRLAEIAETSGPGYSVMVVNGRGTIVELGDIAYERHARGGRRNRANVVATCTAGGVSRRELFFADQVLSVVD